MSKHSIIKRPSFFEYKDISISVPKHLRHCSYLCWNRIHTNLVSHELKGQGRAGLGWAGQGRAGQGRAGQGRAGQAAQHYISFAREIKLI